MKHHFLGNSGLRIGEIGIGTLTWGRDTDIEDAGAILNSLLDAGGNLIDLSPIYGEGNAPSTLGELLRKNYSRNEFVICAHAGWLFDGERYISDSGRSSIITTVERQLTALDTDYIDLLMIDEIPLAQGDSLIPLSETLAAVNYLAAQGKIRYYAFSGYQVWKAAIAWQLMRDTHQTLPIAFGEPYSLLNHDIEQTHSAFCGYSGLGIIGFAPLAGGVLTGKYRNTIPPTSRAATSHLAHTVEDYLEDRPRQITQAVVKLPTDSAALPQMLRWRGF
ncbi:aldo/keto reductase [Arcanobacterium hippocoleae]